MMPAEKPPVVAAVSAPRSAGVVALCERYRTNLSALYEADPELAARVEALPFGALPVLEPARDGRWTARLADGSGRSVYIHSRNRPADEARRLLESAGEIEHPTFLLIGLGLGYLVELIEQQFDQPVVIVLEPELRLVKLALCVVDLARPLRDGRLILLTRDEKRHVHERLKRCTADLALGPKRITLPHAARGPRHVYEAVTNELHAYLEFCKTQILTIFRTARISYRNLLYNLPAYLSQCGVQALRDRLRGYPAIVVSAGPSLARHIPLLRALSDRAVIICVQTVFRLLREAGIEPHFVTSLDYHEVSRTFFDGIDDYGRTVLVAEPKATWHVIDAFDPHRRLVLDHEIYPRLLGELAPPRGSLPAGSTVAHLAFYLAEHLGCDPVVFVGQDLSFSQGLYYLPGSSIERLWAPELGRFCTIENKQWERIVRFRPILRTICDLHGRPAYVDDTFRTYIDQFTRDFARARCEVIQASEAGVLVPGMKPLGLREVARRYCGRALPVRDFRNLIRPVRVERPRVLEALEQRLLQLREMRDVARRTLELLERLAGLIERPAEFNRLIVRIDDLRNAIGRYRELYRTVVEVSSQADLKRYGADRRIGSHEFETPQTARQRLARDRDFVQAFIEGCDFMESILSGCIDRMREGVG